MTHPRPDRRRPRGRPGRSAPRARGRGRHRDGGRGGRRGASGVRGDRDQARCRADGRRDAREERHRRHARAPAGRAGRKGARAVDAGRPAVRPGGVRGRRVRLRAEGSGRYGGRRRPSARWQPASATSIPALGARLVAADAEDRRRAVDDPLSDREREVLRLLALGHTNQEIAKMLYISVRTAETHRAHIMQKLALKSRAELVRYRSGRGAARSATTS